MDKEHVREITERVDCEDILRLAASQIAKRYQIEGGIVDIDARWAVNGHMPVYVELTLKERRSDS